MVKNFLNCWHGQRCLTKWGGGGRTVCLYRRSCIELFHTVFMVLQGHEIELLVGTDVRDGNGSTRVINWCGCIVQEPHPAVRALGFLPEEGHGVYVAR